MDEKELIGKENKCEKRTIYDGIRISKIGADILVLSLSALLMIFIVIALISV